MVRKILFLPIERIEERYSAQWYDWFHEALREAGREYKTFGATAMVKISDGEFLDAAFTNLFKLNQGWQVCDYIDRNRDQKFTVFAMDFWHPVLINIAYMRDALGLDIEIKSMIHAGSYDNNDFLAKKGMRKWAMDFEKSLYRLHDQVFIATNYHRSMFNFELCENGKKFSRVDWPVYLPVEDLLPWGERENNVLFPHRLAEEKNPKKFDEFETEFKRLYPKYKDFQFIKTVDVCKDKEEYYNLMKVSKFVVSFADQETFGIAMQEGINCGCIPIAPSELSYNETIPNEYLFDTMQQACDILQENIERPWFCFRRYNQKIKWINKI